MTGSVLQQAVVIFLVLGIPAMAQAQDAADVPSLQGQVTEVTVYRGQTLVTRTIELELQPGYNEFVVTGLPVRIVPESLFAQGSGTATVLSVRYREHAVRQDVREEIRQVDEHIAKVQRDIYHADRDRQNSENVFNFYMALGKWAVDATNVDLNRSIVQADMVRKIADYLEGKSVQWHQNNVRLEDAKADLEKELGFLQRKREELAGGQGRTERQAVLFISADEKAAAQVRLHYLVNEANWQPQYNLRGDPAAGGVLVEYNAVVNQTSGEDWKGVALSLSTAEPFMVASPPTLDPLHVMLSSVQMPQQAEPNQQAAPGVPGLGGDVGENARQLQMSRKTQSGKGKMAESDLNAIAMGNQLLELNVDGYQLKRIQQQLEETAQVEGVSVSYRLPGRLSLPSRSDQQLVTIAAVSAPAEFTLVATPILTDYVYLQADLLNQSETVLLPGPASMFRNGEFAGRGQVALVTTGERFTAGFGIDSQVQASRELVKKTTRVQGGNKIDTYDYRITVASYKGQPVKLRLLDRIPYTEADSTIKVELVSTGPELSGDREYQRTGRDKGVLRWDLELPANSTGENATVVTYSYTMEYDRNMVVQPRPVNVPQ
ncbi:MAG: mucoidy inhibitor MuiA family protein [Phycisphaerae bacterium]|nr:mucoidy inhibitor MuiA family protein [Phycisphaerae bacterium]